MKKQELFLSGLKTYSSLFEQWLFDPNEISLGPINIFIGPNNSGKSRFIRLLFSELLNTKLGYIDIPITQNNSNQESKDNLIDFILVESEVNLGEFLQDKPLASVFGDNELDSINSIMHQINNTSVDLNDVKTLMKLDIFGRLDTNIIRNKLARMKREVLFGYIDIDSTLFKVREAVNSISIKLLDYKIKSLCNSYYIPIQRGMKPFLRKEEHVTTYDNDKNVRKYVEIENHCSDFYTRRVIDEYFPHMRNYYMAENQKKLAYDPYIFTGLSLYDDLKKKLLGNHQERKKVRDYELFLSAHFFGGKSVVLLPMEDKDVVHISVEQEQDRPIYEWGDGIQTMILITYLPFMEEKGTFFIEEPDLMLHPGMQRRLIDVLASMDGCQFFLTTHSNHLIDMAVDYDSHVFSFQKVENEADLSNPYFKVKEVESHDVQLLRRLGVRHSSSFLVNATIWVEGITDRLYFAKYLEEYHRHLEEEDEKARRYVIDQHYAFVEYGGSNIAHLSYLKTAEEDKDDGINIERLCAKALLILDRDDIDIEQAESVKTPDTLDGKTRRYFLLKEALGKSLNPLPCRETENLLSPEVLQATIHNFREKGKRYDPPELFEEGSYKDVYLGAFIHDKLGDKYGTFTNDKKTVKLDDGSEKEVRSGTISEKVRFCQIALNYITWETMSKEAQELAKRIYEHIKTCNE